MGKIIAIDLGTTNARVAVMADGVGEIVNRVAHRVRADLFRHIGIEDLLSPRVVGSSAAVGP